MASIVWTSVFMFLMLELAVTLLLVIPVPRRIRNWIAKKVSAFNLGPRIMKASIFIGVILTMALAESIHSTLNIRHREMEHKTHDPGMTYTEERLFHDLDKQRKFRSERNTYLAGFSLTLLFVIGRIAQLMQESVMMEEEIESLKKRPTDPNNIEMTQIKSKAQKKKD